MSPDMGPSWCVTRGMGASCKIQVSRIAILRKMPNPTIRIGHGYDLHRLQPGGQLRLGGVVVADDISPVAHSDGDVVIHAIVDALLGAMACGDIGDRFPNTDPRWKNVNSQVFLDVVFSDVQAAGYRLVNIDLTILAERPRLKTFKRRIADHLAGLLACPVSVKAGTNEGCDAIGRGEAIACHAMLLLER